MTESSKEIQVNIVLEESPTYTLNQQTVRMVGFILIDNVNMKLSDLRLKILSELDDQQLQIIGLNFKFLKKTFPVSSKQETSLTLRKICVNLCNSNMSTNINNQPFHPEISPKKDDKQNKHQRRVLFTDQTSRAQSAPHTNNNSLLIGCNNEEKQLNMNQTYDSFHATPMKNNTLDSMVQPFEVLPHHYQYISSHIGMTSPMIQPNTNNVINNNNNNKITNESPFPKITMITTNQNININNNNISQHQTDELEYTIMVRACHNVILQSINRSTSDNEVTLHSLLAADTIQNNNCRRNSKSVSVFSSFDLRETQKVKNDINNNGSVAMTPIKKKKKKKVNNNNNNNNNDDIKRDGSFTASFISTYPISPKSTRLEKELNQKLPRIRPKPSNDLEFIKPSTEVNTILKKAMLTGKDTEEKKQQYIEIEGSLSISVDETTILNLKPINNKNISNKLDPPNCSIVPLKIDRNNAQTLATPPHTFWGLNSNNQTSSLNCVGNGNINGVTNGTAFDFLIDDNIKCKFTVIGSPMINIEESKKDQKDDDIQNNNNNDLNTNIVWEFDNETDLIVGLSGVHHSVTNPLWIDLVCDRNTFINIAEHIRPPIHNLTIEDCLTIDCREKVEIFSNYLFICLKTSSDGARMTRTENINILIFKTMIITYHLGNATTRNLIFSVRKILNKKFGSICPSPSWICHTIIDNVIDKMMPEVESTVREVETCEQFVFKLCNESQNELLHRMQIARAWMVLYRSRLWPKSTITHNLLNNYLWRKDFLSDVPQPYWRDINDHVARMVDLLQLGTQTLESIQNIFVAKVSLEMTQQSNNLAIIGGKLAGVGAVFLPLTVITGIWGMNCKVPFQYNPQDIKNIFGNSFYGFAIVMLIMLLVSIITWKCVNKKGWKD